MPEHFGIYLKHTSSGYRLTRENYAAITNKCTLKYCPEAKDNRYADETGKLYTDKWIKRQQRLIMRNFDLNMKFYSLLDPKKFKRVVTEFIASNPEFKPVNDLELYQDHAGFYLMILDEYCQIYIGKTSASLKKSILGHWSRQMPFDRLLYPEGAVNHSMLSISCFRAFDTTRIYIYESDMAYMPEDSYLHDIPHEFLCNKMVDGIVGFDLMQAIKELEGSVCGLDNEQTG